MDESVSGAARQGGTEQMTIKFCAVTCICIRTYLNVIHPRL